MDLVLSGLRNVGKRTAFLSAVASALISNHLTIADKQETSDLITSVPLAPRIDSTGNTPFEALDAHRTGIDFVHHWEPSRRTAGEINNGLVGGGVSIGDYDGDGWPDVFLTRPSGGARLYRNLGGQAEGTWRFEDVTDKSGIGADPFWATGSSFVDIDNDGDLDLIVNNYEGPSGIVQHFANLEANQRFTITEPAEKGEATPKTPRGRRMFVRAVQSFTYVKHLERLYNDFLRQPLLPNKLSQLGPGMAWGDVDQDGDDDVFVGGAPGQAG